MAEEKEWWTENTMGNTKASRDGREVVNSEFSHLSKFRTSPRSNSNHSNLHVLDQQLSHTRISASYSVLKINSLPPWSSQAQISSNECWILDLSAIRGCEYIFAPVSGAIRLHRQISLPTN